MCLQLLTGRCYAAFLLKFSVFGLNIPGLYIIRRFDQISFHTRNSSLEGATKLKFAPVPLEMVFQMIFFFAKIEIFRFWLKSLDYIVRCFDLHTCTY